MLYTAPVAKKIADRSEGGSDSSIDIIKNTEAIKSVTDFEEEDKKKKRSDGSSDSFGTTITEDNNIPPETEGGPVGEVEGSELPTSVDSKVGVSSNTSDDSGSSSDESSSTGGRSKIPHISGSDSSDSTRSHLRFIRFRFVYC
jgi:hypothetical protein